MVSDSNYIFIANTTVSASTVWRLEMVTLEELDEYENSLTNNFITACYCKDLAKAEKYAEKLADFYHISIEEQLSASERAANFLSNKHRDLVQKAIKVLKLEN